MSHLKSLLLKHCHAQYYNGICIIRIQGFQGAFCKNSKFKYFFKKMLFSIVSLELSVWVSMKLSYYLNEIITFTSRELW